MERATEIALPEDFKKKMRQLLGEEYETFVLSYEAERVQGLRFNTGKMSLEEGLSRMGGIFGLTKIPWGQEGYYYDTRSRPGKHPCHEAGAYYIQEPSAMAVVELLDPQPGDVVLDLCAAPGGKSTHIAQRLKGQGFLLSNEIHPARAKALSQNIERMGIGNAVVTNEDSRRLADYFPVFFNKIVVDAPCSGEGMFRKDEGARTEWSIDNVALCARRQQEILDNAAGMLKGGGRLVYSTCTFSPEENEGSIQLFLETHPEFHIEKVQAYKGFGPGHPEWITGGCEELAWTYRIWPHKVKGEGHYLAVLRKEECAAEPKRKVPVYVKDKTVLNDFGKFTESVFTDMGERMGTWVNHLILFGDQLYTLPDLMIEYKGLKVVRPGLHLGTMKKNRFEPSHALALHVNSRQVHQWYGMDSGSEETVRYLSGETLIVSDTGRNGCRLGESGWVLMLVDGCSIGWAKLVGMTLKNHYPKGLRRPRQPLTPVNRDRLNASSCWQHDPQLNRA